MADTKDTRPATDPADGLLHDLPLADIQEDVNFPIFAPDGLAGWDITWTLRREQPPGGRGRIHLLTKKKPDGHRHVFFC